MSSIVAKSVEPVNTASPWAVRLNIDSIEMLGQLRLQKGVMVHLDGNSIWLQGDTLDDRLANQLRSIPDAERFHIVDDGQLTGWNETVPRDRMPSGTWQPISQWLSVQLPQAAFAGQVHNRVQFKLVRSDEPLEANLMRLDWIVWRDYAVNAPNIRLNPLSFAVSESKEVIVRGAPLPPLPGCRHVKQAGIAIPCGWRADPPIDSESLRMALKLPMDELAIFTESGQMEVIPESVFVHATRSAVRLTDESLRA